MPQLRPFRIFDLSDEEERKKLAASIEWLEFKYKMAQLPPPEKGTLVRIINSGEK